MPLKKDKDRRKGKYRCCCLGNRIYSTPCHACYFALQDDFDEQDEFILFFKSFCCNTSYASHCHSAKQLLWQRIGYKKNSAPNSSDDLCLFFCIYPSSMHNMYTLKIRINGVLCVRKTWIEEVSEDYLKLRVWSKRQIGSLRNCKEFWAPDGS